MDHRRAAAERWLEGFEFLICLEKHFKSTPGTIMPIPPSHHSPIHHLCCKCPNRVPDIIYSPNKIMPYTGWNSPAIELVSPSLSRTIRQHRTYGMTIGIELRHTRF